MILICLNAYIIITFIVLDEAFKDHVTDEEYKNFYILAGLAIFFKAGKLFVFLKMFPTTAYFLAQVIATFFAIQGFVVMVLIVII